MVVDKLREIIKEEIRNHLFGRPVPQKGEPGYNAYLHDFETLFTRATHYEQVSNLYGGAFLEIRSYLETESWPDELKLEEIEKSVREYGKKIREIEREFNRDLKELKRSSGK